MFFLNTILISSYNFSDFILATQIFVLYLSYKSHTYLCVNFISMELKKTLPISYLQQ